MTIARWTTLLWIFTGCTSGGPNGEEGDADADADSDADADADSDADADPEGTSFFATSTGHGPAGGDYGGLAGADAWCAELAGEAGLPAHTWRAYLSATDEDARDRIGDGPWQNIDGVVVATDVDALHEAGIPTAALVDEYGVLVPDAEHDIITGSGPDGRLPQYAYTCNDWTTNADDAYAMVGHSIWSDDQNLYDNWNSVHETQCSEDGMATTLSSGRIYCFAR